MSKSNANSGSGRATTSQPSAPSRPSTNPNYPSTTGKPSGPDRGNTPKSK